jgi:hypothetical protein
VSAIVAIVRSSFAVILLALWALNFPHHPVSDFVGALFPWPSSGSVLRWPALLTEGAIVEGVLCIPTVLLLVAVFRAKAPLVAGLLAVVFFVHIAFELRGYAGASRQEAFLVYLATAHASILLGGTFLLRRRLLRRASPASLRNAP